MTKVTINGIEWSLDKQELIQAVEGLREEQTVRRSYDVRRCGGGEVFIKYFLEKGVGGFLRNRLAARGKREYTVGKRITSFSISTPLPLGYGIGKSGSFIVEESIEGQTFRAAFIAGDERGRLLDSLALLLRKLALSGVRHNDLHLENLLVAADRLYLIDLHKATIKPGHFSETDEVSNLTHALTMIYQIMTETEKERFFREYGKPVIREAAEKGLQLLKKGWIDSKKKRAFSTTSKLIRQGDRVYIRGRQTEGTDRIPSLIKKDRKVRIERYNDHIRKFYRDNGRLRKAWGNHVVLEYLEEAVVPAPFFVELRPFRKYGFIAMEDLGGHGEELDRFLDRNYDSMDGRARRDFIKAFSRFLVRLIAKEILQVDFKACNVFVLPDGFRLLDVEDIRFRFPGEEDVKRLLLQLNLSVPGRIRISDRLRFFIKLARVLPFDRKQVFRDVVRRSRAEEIVYEGVSGLKKETWSGHPRPAPSPFSRLHRG